MDKTNFAKVMEFNRAFDMVSSDPDDYTYYIDSISYPYKYIRLNIFDNSPATIKLRLDLIREELDELIVAIDENDIIEQRDACADILYVVYGMADVLGIDINSYLNNKLMLEYKDILNINTNSNFYKVKMVVNNILGFNMFSKTTAELLQFGKEKLNSAYLLLENNCNNNNLNINEKFEYIAENMFNLLIWTYITTMVIGTNADNDFAIVHDSNMSKLCSTEADAIATVEDYKQKYELKTSPYDSPYYYYLPKLNKWIVKNLSTGKALKNIKYKKVEFTNLRFIF